jgi:hypothetical protein
LLIGVVLSLPSFIASANRPQDQAEPFSRIESSVLPPYTRWDDRTRRTVTLPSRQYGVYVDLNRVRVELEPVDLSALGPFESNQIGVSREIGGVLESRGEVITNPDGSTIRVLAVQSPGARALRLHFEGFDVPGESQAFVYGAGIDSHVAGPYSGRGPFGDGEFWSDTIPGDTAIIEYYSRGGEYGNWRVPEISHIYSDLQASLVPQVLACEEDASCYSDPVKNAVGRIVFVTGSGAFVCSGTMLNNRTGDFSPFFLTASHCISNETSARTVETFWFYQTVSCNSETVNPNWATSGTGATLLGTSSASDSTLIRILGPVPGGVVFSGWDTSPKGVGTNAFGLHHPGGSIPPSIGSVLRRAGGTIAATGQSCPPSGLVNGYEVDWTTGNTEPGSSGSGLWGSSNLVIGVLSCGPSNVNCTTRFSLYGRFSDFYPVVQTFLDNGGGAFCIDSIVPASRTFDAAGGNGDITVTAEPGCDWTATKTGDWITVTSGASGTGSGVVAYTVAANPDTSPRFGSLTIKDQVHTITQDGASCSYSLFPETRTFPPTAGSGSVTITAPQGCGWTASSTAAWIVLNSSPSGSGNGVVDYLIQPNPETSERSGSIAVQGRLHTITQEGLNCTYVLTPANQPFGSKGGSGSVTIASPAGCKWTATSHAPWLTITSAVDGSGDGVVTYDVAANPSNVARQGSITIASATLSVVQAGNGPLILGAAVDGRKLLVTGVNFDQKAKLFMDGVKQKKVSGDPGNLGTVIVAKKSGKKIAPGQTVMLQVKNQDGLMSPGFPFTRPGVSGASRIEVGPSPDRGRAKVTPRRRP